MFQGVLSAAIKSAKDVFAGRTGRSRKFDEADWSRLNKLATTQKNAGEIDRAVTTLRSLKEKCDGDYADTRLAMYLQQAGKFEEAMQEIDWLISTSGPWAQRLFGHQSATVIQCQRSGWCARIHSAAVLICKREKRSDLQALHQAHYEKYKAINQRLHQLEVAATSKANGTR